MKLHTFKATLSLFLTTAVILFGVDICTAEEVIIQDTSGNVRAQTALDGSPDSTVTMTITDASGNAAADGTVVTLTPVGGGAAITATSIGGQVVFTGIPAGSFVVSTTSAATFTGITIAGASAALAGGVAGGTAGAIVGAAAIVTGSTLAIDDANNGKGKGSLLSPMS